MVSDQSTPRPPDEGRSEAERVRDAAARETGSAREEAARAGENIRDGASRLASGARGKAYEQAEAGKSFAAENIDDFTAAIRKASEELGERDQSMAANLVREAASGLEQMSGAIQGRSVQELTRSVAGFARRQPAAFLIGAALAGVALGRFARASSDHGDGGYDDDHRFRRHDRDMEHTAGFGRREDRERTGGDASDRDSQGSVSGTGASTSGSNAAATATDGSARSASSFEAGGAGVRSAASSAGLAGVTRTGIPATPSSAGTTPGATSEPGTATDTNGGRDVR